MLNLLKRIFGDSIVYGIGNVGQKLAGMLLVPIYTRFLVPNDYGILAITTSVVSVLGTVLGMGLNGSIVRLYHDESDSSASTRGAELLGAGFVAYLSLGLPICLALTIMGAPVFGALFKSMPFYPYLILAIWTAFFARAPMIPLGLLRARRQATLYVTISLGKLLLSFAGVIALVVGFGLGVYGAVMGTFVVSALFFAWTMYYVIREARGKQLHLRSAGLALLSFGIPLIPHALSGWMLEASDRYVLERMTTLSDVGIYNFGYQVGSIGKLVLMAVSFAWVPIYYGLAKKDASQASALGGRVFTVILLMISSVTVAVMLFANEVVGLLGTKGYLEATQIVPTIAFAYLMQGMYSISAVVMLQSKRTRTLAMISVPCAAVNIGLNILLIRWLGVMGAAYATLISFSLLWIVTHFVAQSIFRIQYEYGRIATIVALVGGIYLALLAIPAILGSLGALAKAGLLVAYGGLLLLFRVVTLKQMRDVFRTLVGRRAETPPTL